LQNKKNIFSRILPTYLHKPLETPVDKGVFKHVGFMYDEK